MVAILISLLSVFFFYGKDPQQWDHIKAALEGRMSAGPLKSSRIHFFNRSWALNVTLNE